MPRVELKDFTKLRMAQEWLRQEILIMINNSTTKVDAISQEEALAYEFLQNYPEVGSDKHGLVQAYINCEIQGSM